MSTLEITESTSSLGVDNSLGDTFTIEMRHVLQKVVVLEKERPARPQTHGSSVGFHGSTGLSGQVRLYIESNGFIYLRIYNVK